MRDRAQDGHSLISRGRNAEAVTEVEDEGNSTNAHGKRRAGAKHPWVERGRPHPDWIILSAIRQCGRLDAANIPARMFGRPQGVRQRI
jgi:hypothetical protein